MHCPIFISYRRKDSAAEAGRLHSSISRALGEGTVFMDTTSIEPGQQWPQELEEALNSAQIVLVIMGTEWLRISDEWGIRRIDNKDDWVRREIETTLDRRTKIFPILLNGAKFPPADKLPLSIQGLTNYQAHEVRTDHWEQDVEPLLQQLTSLKRASSNADKPKVKYDLPSLPNGPFIGRENLLKEIHTRFIQQEAVPRVVALTGMPCVGKSALALKYAHTHKNTYYKGGICWVTAAQGNIDSQIIQSLAEIPGFFPKKPKELPMANQLRFCWNHWPGGDMPVLVIMDDIDTYRQIAKYFNGLSARFHFLLTSRKKLRGCTNQISVNTLSPSESLNLFRALLGNPSRLDRELSQVQKLCQWLGHLPLPIQMTVDYLNFDPSSSIAGVYAQLQKNKLANEVLQEEYSKEDDMWARNNVAQAFFLSWQRLTEEARQLGNLLSHLAPTPFPWSFIEDAGDSATALTLEQDRNNLMKFDLLQYDSEQNTYQMNRLLQTFFSERLQDSPTKLQILKQAEQIVTAYCQNAPTLFNTQNFLTAKRIIPHIEAVVKDHLTTFADETVLLPLITLLRYYRDQGDTANAKFWSAKALEAAIQHFGTDHIQVATVLQEQGFLYCVTRQPQEALTTLQQALDLYEALNQTNTLECALAHQYKSTACRMQGNDRQAEEEILIALRIREQLLPEDNPTVTEAQITLSSIQVNRGDDAATLEPLLEQLLATRRTQLGQSHPQLPEVIDMLAKIYERQDKLSKAEPLYCEAVEINQTVFGNSHPQTAFGYNNLAKFYQSKGKLKTALPLYCDAIEILEDERVQMHVPAARCRHNLGMLYLEQGEPQKALHEFEQAYAIFEKDLPPQHPWLQECREGINDC